MKARARTSRPEKLMNTRRREEIKSLDTKVEENEEVKELVNTTK